MCLTEKEKRKIWISYSFFLNICLSNFKSLWIQILWGIFGPSCKILYSSIVVFIVVSKRDLGAAFITLLIFYSSMIFDEKTLPQENPVICAEALDFSWQGVFIELANIHNNVDFPFSSWVQNYVQA